MKNFNSLCMNGSSMNDTQIWILERLFELKFGDGLEGKP